MKIRNMVFIFIFLIKIFSLIYADENRKDIFILNDIFICPIGWESEKEIQDSLKNIKIDIINSAKTDGKKCILKSPINGKLKNKNDLIIIENEEYRIIYPKIGDILVLNKTSINMGEPIMVINEFEENSLIIFLKSKNSPFDYIYFKDNEFLIKLENPTEIFSIYSGNIRIIPYEPFPFEEDIEAEDKYNVISMPIGYCIIDYSGISNITIKKDSEISKGKKIGVAGNGFNNNFFIIQMVKIQYGELNPNIIYLEVLKN